MEQTGNYQLNLWDGEDRILREDFNADNVKTEEALADVAAQAALISKCGNCRIVYGSYAGSGKYGSGNQNSLSFDLPPVFVLVIPGNNINNKDAVRLNLLKNVLYSVGCPENSGYINTVAWSGNHVEWYGLDAYGQFNASGYTYHYVALLATDA